MERVNVFVASVEAVEKRDALVGEETALLLYWLQLILVWGLGLMALGEETRSVWNVNGSKVTGFAFEGVRTTL